MKLLMSSCLIAISFFMGINYSEHKNQIQLEKILNTKSFINLKITKTKLDIENSNQNIIVTINGKKLDGSVEMKLCK